MINWLAEPEGPEAYGPVPFHLVDHVDCYREANARFARSNDPGERRMLFEAMERHFRAWAAASGLPPAL